LMVARRGGRELAALQTFHQPFVHPGDYDFFRAHVAQEFLTKLGLVEQIKSLAVDFVADDEEIRLPRHRIHYALNLVNAVQFVIDRAGYGQARVQAFENGWQFRLPEVAEKDARGSRSAIHKDHI